MKIGAYAFPVTGKPEENLARIREGMNRAAQEHVRLLLFPECALTGYPPYDILSADAVDPIWTAETAKELQAFCTRHGMTAVLGSVWKANGKTYDTALCFSPDGRRTEVFKQAVWGWDRDNFSEGEKDRILVVDGLRVGIRICYEVRFPEYFRSLYRERTDLNLVLFYDVSGNNPEERYELMRSVLRTRAMENICPIVSCTTAGGSQSAPTGIYGRNGRVLRELERGEEGLLVYDLVQTGLEFGEEGRKILSDRLTGLDGKENGDQT